MAVICQFVEDLLLLVGKNNVCVERLHHEQSFAQSPRTFTQHLVISRKGKILIISKMHANLEDFSLLLQMQTNLIRLHGDNGAQSEDEGVNVFHVQVICSHSIGHRVSS